MFCFHRMDKLKSVYVDSALSIIKGALCVILQIPTGRSTESIKRKTSELGIITVKSVVKEPTSNDYNDIRQLIKSKIEEKCPFYNYRINRQLAEKLYGDSIYDNFGLAKEISEINLIVLEEWNINCNRNRILKNSGLIKNIEINKFKYLSAKESLEVHFEVVPTYTFNELKELYTEEKDICSFLLSPIVEVKSESEKENVRLKRKDDEHELEDKDNIVNDIDDDINEKKLQNRNLQLDELTGKPIQCILEGDALPKFKVVPPSGVENIKETFEASKTVTPWEVNIKEGESLNYDKLIKEFGCSRIKEEHIKKIEQLTNKKAHHFIRRGIFFSHRDLDFLLNYYEQHKCFYIYTGRGPSSASMHLGHLIPFYFCKYLQDVFKVPLVIQLSDDEKFLFNPQFTSADINNFANENVKDIIAVGFDPELTFIFKNTDYVANLYSTVLEIHKKTTLNQSMNVFGFTNSDNIGKIAYPSFQIAPCFSQCFPHFLKKNIPCIVPQGIDQDPYFRVSRDIAVKMALYKPVVIHSVFMPGLQGVNSKMSSTQRKKKTVVEGDREKEKKGPTEKEDSSTINNNVIFLTDTAEHIKHKINKYAFSGGGATIAEHKEKGANLDIDIAYQYLRYFIEDDDKLNEIGEKYKKGEMLSGEIKKILIDVVVELVQNHQKKRNALTEEEIKYFFSHDKPALRRFKDV